MSSSLNLVILSTRFAVCRLTATASVPSWALLPKASNFVSVTRSSDELSVVCRQELVPSTVSNVERDWAGIKVQGPLDFGLTGILSSLAKPLADAGIPIFAVSTFDTDYLLVKEEKLSAAVAVLKDCGNHVTKEKEAPAEETDNTTVVLPRDKPAEVFEPDPFVAPLVESAPFSETFGLVVVAGWPPNRNDLLPSYAAFRAAVELCFAEDDVSSYAPRTQPPPVYLYPFSALHVTVATLHAFVRPPQDNHDVLETKWRNVVERAQENTAWPKSLQLRLDSAQLGSKAGVLLWKEAAGGMQAMRECLQQATDEMAEELKIAGVSVETLSIPDIVHSTFCRFYQTPSTPGRIVQERFQQGVLPRLQEFFPDTYRVPHVSLVCERQPYMHIPDDDRHVLMRCILEPKEDEDS